MRASRRAVVFVAAFLLTISTCMGAASTKGEVRFEAGPPDGNGLFTVTLSLRNMALRGFQFVLRYDTTMIVPVDASGSRVTSFSGFGEKVAGLDWLTLTGTGLDTVAGKIDFSGYLMPGATGTGIDGDGQMNIGSEGAKVLTLRFRQLKTGDCGLRLATQGQGEPYTPACPSGMILENRAGAVPAEITFGLPAQLGGESTTTPDVVPPSGGGSAGGGSTGGGVVAPTAKELLEHSILLKIDSHAALVRGGVTAIYPSEPQVTAYTRSGRTFVPVRFVAERLGAEVDWENESGTAVIRKGGHTIRMTVGSNTYTLDGVQKPMDAPAELRASANKYARTMVPIRFVGEALGYQVAWDYERQFAIVSEAEYPWDLTGKTVQQALREADSLLTGYGGFV